MGEERRYSAEFKKAAVERMATHGSVQGLADELGIRRKFLYLWRSQFEQFGEAALARGRGRPKGSRSSTVAKPASKQLEVDFFRQAFEHVRGGRAKNSTSGAKGSTAPSELNSRSKEN